jgi:hypothetical protein
VVSKSGWYDLYDDNGKKYNVLSNSIGEIVSVSSNGFTVRKSAWLDTYDSNGNKINTRSAR